MRSLAVCLIFFGVFISCAAPTTSRIAKGRGRAATTHVGREDQDSPKKGSTNSKQALEEGLALLESDVVMAKQHFLMAIDADPNCYQAQMNLAILATRRGQFAEASHYYEAALRARPGFLPAVIGLAVELERANDIETALRLLRSYADRLPEIGARLAQLLARQGQLDAAREQAVLVLHTDERNAQAMVALGMVYRRQHRIELAQLALNQAIEIDPHSGEAYHELGLVLVAQDQTAQAVLAFEKAVEANPDIAAFHNNLGVLRSEVGAFKLAIESLEQAVRLSPKTAAYVLNLGNALRGEQRYEEAEHAYRKALEMGNGLPEALYNLGILYLDNELTGQETLSRLRTSVDFLRAYLNKAPSESDRVQLASYIETAQKGIENEEKRLARERQRTEKEAEKRRLTEEAETRQNTNSKAED